MIEKLIKFFKSLKPNQIFMIVGTLGMVLGAVGTVGGYTVVPGEETMVFVAGVVIFLLGGAMASMRAYMEAKKK